MDLSAYLSGYLHKTHSTLPLTGNRLRAGPSSFLAKTAVEYDPDTKNVAPMYSGAGGTANPYIKGVRGKDRRLNKNLQIKSAPIIIIPPKINWRNFMPWKSNSPILRSPLTPDQAATSIAGIKG